MLWRSEEIGAGGCGEPGLRRLPVETLQAGDKIKMLVACDERGIVLARQGRDPDVIFRYRVTAALQFMAYFGI
jgi:hypothetical protein